MGTEKTLRSRLSIRRKSLTVLAGVLALVALIVFLRQTSPHGAAPSVELPNATEMAFGLQREPLTRTVVIDPCSGESAAPQRCADADAAIEAAYVVRDFTGGQCAELVLAENERRPVDLPLPTVSKSGQFPAQQITVAGTPAGRGVKLTITATPDKQERVQPGTYCGQLVVERTVSSTTGPASSDEIKWNVVIRLQDRDSFGNLLSVLLWLTAGGALGMLVRAVNSELLPSVPLWRRYRRLRAWHDMRPTARPSWFSPELEAARIAIRQRDTEVATSQIAALEAQRQRLDGVQGALLDEAKEIITDLRAREIEKLDKVTLGLVLNRIERIRNRSDLPDEKSVEDLRGWVAKMSAAEAAVTSYETLRNTDHLNTANTLVRDLVTGANVPAPTRSATVGHVRSGADLPRVDSIKPFEHAMNLSWWIGTILSLVIVVGAGLKTQYLDAADFTDATGSWFALGLFGFAVQVSTTSLVEAAGRLAPSTRT